VLRYKQKICIIFIWIVLPVTAGWGGEDPFEPWKFGNQPVPDSRVSQENETASLPARMALRGLRFFSEYISKVDGDRCPMYPTCASYSRQAIQKHGFFIGVVMTADRLIHETTEMEYAPMVKVGNSVRFYDPLSENNFWWYQGDGLDK